ncbi:MAG: glycosyltransferase [Rhodocyclaceae bacterium]
MNKKIASTIDFIRHMGLDGAVIAIPYKIAIEDVSALHDDPICKGLVLRDPDPEVVARFPASWLGRFDGRGWQLPTVHAPIVFMASQLMLTREMSTQVVRSGRRHVICLINGRFQKLSMYRFLLWRAGDKLIRNISLRSESHPLRKGVAIAKKIPLLRTLWRALFRREDLSAVSGSKPVDEAGGAQEVLYTALLQSAQAAAKNADYECIRGRVLLVNAGLAAGGAERQIVNTLIGLKASGLCESVSLLAEYIDHAPNLDFFLHELHAADIEVSQVRRSVSLVEDGLYTVRPEVAELLADIASGLIEEILNLVEEFRARRPEVVHAWQDASSIKAGIAAVIAGVPRVVLASRNVTPMNFSYHQSYMYPAYRALASLECVSFLNNSEAGAEDYARWLGLPRGRFAVVRNGVDLGDLRRVDDEAMQGYRRAVGIPDGALVVGSVFRFWEEKRPMLWLQMAALLADRYPDIHFLVVGEGPLRREMESFINAHGLKSRVHLPGARPDVATPLSAMNVFVLTSEFEGTPNVILEAQWLGLPIVSTDAGGARESFAEGHTGFLASTGTAEEIAALVSRYVGSLADRAGAEKLGPDFVRDKFGLARMVRETIALYDLRGGAQSLDAGAAAHKASLAGSLETEKLL